MTRSGLRNLLLGLFSAACLGFTGLVGYTLLFVSTITCVSFFNFIGQRTRKTEA